MTRSLDGLVFVPVADQAPGQVGRQTRFEYHERDGLVWADYRGGDVVKGHLVGTRRTTPSTSATSSSVSTARQPRDTARRA